MKRILSSLIVTMFAVVMLGSMAQAELGRSVNITTNEPVEIPGRVLSPGHYIFQTMNDGDGPSMVEVYKAGDTDAYGLFPVRVTDRRKAGRTKVVIGKVDGINRIKGFYFGGDTMGVKFLFPAQRNLEVANTKTSSSTAQGD